MSLCNKKIGKRPYNNGVLITELQEKYGHSNIFRVNTELSVCTEIFNGPTVDTNLNKIQTGLTESSMGVFIIDDLVGGEVPINFIFSGDTNIFNDYVGEFVYEIYGRSTESEFPEITTVVGDVPPPPLFKPQLTYSESVNFSDISQIISEESASILEFIPNLTPNNEWLLNYTYNFKRQSCLSGDFYFGETIGNNYDEESSFYFITLSNPSDMVLGPFLEPEPTTPEILTLERRERPFSDPSDTYVLGVPIRLDDKIKGCRLRVETLPISLPTTSIFTVDGLPTPNSLMVSVNGITLSPDDYTVTNNTIITLNQPLLPDSDIITATYVECEERLDVVYSEQFQILTGITSGVTSGVTIEDKVYFNTDQGKFEYYIDFTTEEPEDMVLYLNGVKLTYGVDFYLSVTVPNRLIFDSIELNLTDIIYIVYTTDGRPPGDYGLITYDNQLEWETSQPPVVNERNGGKFIVEITNPSDVGFTSLNKVEIEIGYEDGVSLYSTTIPINTLQSNENYIWRVVSVKYYTGLLGNVFETKTISETGKFSTNNLINSY